MKARLGLFSVLFFLGMCLAQYPNKPVTIVVGFEPGGGTDTTARILQPVLRGAARPANRGREPRHAGGNIAVDHVAKAAPDGYTLVLANVGALAVNPHILKTPYDPLKDLAPISMAAEFASAAVQSLNVKTAGDFVKLAQSKPATVTYASSAGGAGHLSGEL